MNKSKAAAILQEFYKRHQSVKWFDGSFKEQIDFVNDKSEKIAALCSRRAAKSFSCGLKMLKCAYENPGSVIVYLGLTRETAAKTMINPVLKVINKRLKLGAKFTKIPLSCILPNESIIYLAGVNNSDNEQEKLLGQKFRMIVVDEAASYTIDLKKLLEEVLGPTTIDQNGTIILAGTPGNFRNFFYNITTGTEKGWSLHSWSTAKNPHTSKQFLAKIEKFKKEQPEFLETSTFKQHYEGLWFIDESKMLYKYSEERNLIRIIPEQKYTYVLGMDLGFNDATTFVVGCYSDTDPTLYYVYSFGASGMLIDNVIHKIREIEKLFPINAYVIDSASKQVVEDLRYRTRIPFQAATKIDKLDTIQMMNSDFITKRIKVLPSCSDLIDEWKTLIIDDSNPAKPQELASQHNDRADSALYVWRKSLHYRSEPIPVKSKLTMDQEADRLFEKARNKLNHKDNDIDLKDW